MNLPDVPVPQEGFFVTHFLTVEDQVRSREFYAGILGGQVVAPENPCIIKLANSWIILNTRGGPTPDKPEVSLEVPQHPNNVNSFLNLRVANIHACYTAWKAKGAHFLTGPLDNHGWETRCYMRDPDGYIIEVGQPTQKMIDLFKNHARVDMHDDFPTKGMAFTHILVVSDLEQSKHFYVDVLGAELYREYGGTSCVVSFLDSWLLIVTGGGPTQDKPEVTFTPPEKLNSVSHAMTIRVPDCHQAYEMLKGRGAEFLTPPVEWDVEIRCFFRDPDGHLLEMSQSL